MAATAGWQLLRRRRFGIRGGVTVSPGVLIMAVREKQGKGGSGSAEIATGLLLTCESSKFWARALGRSWLEQEAKCAAMQWHLQH